MDYDVVVVGAGPAGSATAKNIARSGFKVLVVEEHDRVGEPSFCSGLVTPRSLQAAGVSSRVLLNTLKGAVVHSASGKELSLGGDKVHALAIDRVAFDQELAEQARQAGAELRLGSKLRHIERRNGHLTLDLEVKERPLSISTRLLVGADGANSMVARWINGAAKGEIVRAIGVKAKLAPQATDRVDIFVGESIAPGWFGWIIPLGDNLARVGIGDGNGSGKTLPQLLRDLIAAFPRLFHGVELGEPGGHVLPLYAPIKTYDDNVLLVGDAARQVKPTTGGGLYVGLIGAKHCAQTAVEALNSEDFSRLFLSRYETAWKGDIGTELERARDLRRMFLSLSGRDIDRLFDLLGTYPLRKLVNQFGDIDFQSPMFTQLVNAAPLLCRFVRLPFFFSAHWGTGTPTLFDSPDCA